MPTMPKSLRGVIMYVMIMCATSFSHAAPTLTASDYKLVMDTYKRCTTGIESSSYDCDCLAVTYLDQVQRLRTKMERRDEATDDIKHTIAIQHDELMGTARKVCLNWDKAAAFNYGQCLHMNKDTRDNTAQFCGCYALDYTDRSNNVDAEQYTDPAILMSRSITACNKRYPR